MITQSTLDQLTYDIIGCCIEVHKCLGPGLLENVYEKCLEREIQLRGFSYKSQLFLPIEYKEMLCEKALRIDILVEDLILIEVKAVESLMPVHEAQLLTYMKLLRKPKGLLVNFNCTNIFREGQKILINEWYTSLSR